jgi:hypothetical protein
MVFSVPRPVVENSRITKLSASEKKSRATSCERYVLAWLFVIYSLGVHLLILAFGLDAREESKGYVFRRCILGPSCVFMNVRVSVWDLCTMKCMLTFKICCFFSVIIDSLIVRIVSRREWSVSNPRDMSSMSL